MLIDGFRAQLDCTLVSVSVKKSPLLRSFITEGNKIMTEILIFFALFYASKSFFLQLLSLGRVGAAVVVSPHSTLSS